MACARSKRLNGLNHKKSSIFTGSRKITKNQGKLRWVIKESSVAGLAGMQLKRILQVHYSCATSPCTLHNNYADVQCMLCLSTLWVPSISTHAFISNTAKSYELAVCEVHEPLLPFPIL